MNMKLSAKPISSPGRTEKFPPPLMRFLRSNVGSRSRSRSRSRSSPMFVRKKTSAIETTQEPSSPKVTCMGQVRVRRSSNQNAAKRDTTPARRRRRCWWLRHALFYGAKTTPCQTLWPRWGFFRRKARTESNSRERHNEEDELEEDEYENRVNANDSVSTTTTTPPKNALLLTRCRSAPYRSSSLASRFLGSPLRSEEEAEEKQRTKMENRELTESTQEKLGFSIIERMIKSEKIRVEEAGEFARPLILTRCKSEPARIAQKLDPELNFWKKTRLAFADS